MSTKQVFQDKQVTVYQKTDDGILGTGLLATHTKEYVAVDRGGSRATGKSVGEAVSRLEQGQRAKLNR